MNNKVRYIYDKNGNEKEVVVPITKWTSIMEDLSDLRSIEKRRKEKSISLKLVKERLKKNA